jgi:1,4-dihydroxy-2-naphthoyl-CoA hydrolase
MNEIWFARPSPEALNDIHRQTAVESLGIRIVEVGDDFLRGTMPVDSRTLQPYGLLHGGASLLLAETLGSSAAMAVVDTARFMSVGATISANHIRGATHGTVTGTARPLHIGRSSHLWEIDVRDEEGREICLARLTTMVVSAGRLPRAGQ